MKSHYGHKQLMITAAHRYCLGRSSYIVSECCEWLMRIWHKIEPEVRERIICETREAIALGLADHKCDVENWNELLAWAKSYTGP